jgi:hypothetical protein
LAKQLLLKKTVHWLILFVFGGVALAQDRPDVREIVRRSVAVNDADFNALPLYAHRDTDVEIKLDAAGNVHTRSRKTVEHLMIDGSPYEKLIARDGKPLTAAEEQKEEQKLRQEIQRRKTEPESSRAARIAKFQKSRESDRLMMHQILEAFNFTFVRQEMVDGRPTYVLDGTPNPNFQPDNQEGKVLTGMKGRIWIDKAGYHWVKVHAEVTKPVTYGLFIAKVGPGTQFEFELSPVENNIWLPKRFIQDVNAKVLGIKSVRTREEETYTNYHRSGDLRAQR